MKFLSSKCLKIGGLMVVVFFMTTVSSRAQCAMCKAVAENGIDENGYGIAAGLNSGIIFLMGMPYILLGILILVFYRKQFFGFWRSFSNIHSN